MGITCEKCGSLLIRKEIGGELFFVCRKCGWRSEERLEVTELSKHEEKMVFEVPSTSETVTITCPKCGNRKAYHWMMQTRAIDEPPTSFFRCVKCSHTWRSYE